MDGLLTIPALALAAAMAALAYRYSGAFRRWADKQLEEEK